MSPGLARGCFVWFHPQFLFLSTVCVTCFSAALLLGNSVASVPVDSLALLSVHTLSASQALSLLGPIQLSGTVQTFRSIATLQGLRGDCAPLCDLTHDFPQ